VLILERCHAGEWRLLGSEAVDYEISRIPDMDRRRKVFYLASVACVKQIVTETVQACAEELERLGFKALDALYLACAEAENAEVFLTTADQLLAKARKHRNVLHVRVANPILWLMGVTDDGYSQGDPS